jgi:four helix bundle protein
VSGGYRELRAWSKSIDLAVRTYGVTEAFPKHELFGLVSQMRRAAVAIPSDIAEGHGRFTPGEFLNIFSHSHGSLNELETQIEIALRLSYIAQPVHRTILQDCSEVGRLVTGLKRYARGRR